MLKSFLFTAAACLSCALSTGSSPNRSPHRSPSHTTTSTEAQNWRSPNSPNSPGHGGNSPGHGGGVTSNPNSPCLFDQPSNGACITCWDGTQVTYSPFTTACQGRGGRTNCPGRMCANLMSSLGDYGCDWNLLDTCVYTTGTAATRTCSE